MLSISYRYEDLKYPSYDSIAAPLDCEVGDKSSTVIALRAIIFRFMNQLSHSKRYAGIDIGKRVMSARSKLFQTWQSGFPCNGRSMGSPDEFMVPNAS